MENDHTKRQSDNQHEKESLKDNYMCAICKYDNSKTVQSSFGAVDGDMTMSSSWRKIKPNPCMYLY